MKKFLLAGASVLAMTVASHAADVSLGRAPVLAAPQPAALTGDLSVFAGSWSYSDTDSTSYNGTTMGGLARANYWFAPDMSFQLDLGADSVFDADGSEGDWGVNIAAHISKRSAGGLLGAFASMGTQEYWWGKQVTVGVEAQSYMGPMHLYGQVGFTNEFADGALNAFYGVGELRYFLNPNLMIAGNLGLASLNEGGSHFSAVRWGLDAEMRLNQSPFSLTASYLGTRNSETDESETATNHQFMVGLKAHFGNMSLQQQSLAGATLKDFNPMSGVGRIQLFDSQ